MVRELADVDVTADTDFDVQVGDILFTEDEADDVRRFLDDERLDTGTMLCLDGPDAPGGITVTFMHVGDGDVRMLSHAWHEPIVGSVDEWRDAFDTEPTYDEEVSNKVLTASARIVDTDTSVTLLEDEDGDYWIGSPSADDDVFIGNQRQLELLAEAVAED